MKREVTITHPSLGTASVLPESVKVWERKGWTLADDSNSVSPVTAKQEEAYGDD